MLCYCPHVVVCIGIVVTTVSVVVPSAMDPTRLPLPRLLPAIGPSGKPLDNDDNNDHTGEPCLPVGRASQT